MNINDYFQSLPLDDEKTWDLICSGNVAGIFQIESNLGHKFSKELAPRNIEELAALISLMRPSCLNVKTDGKSVMERYIDRKHEREPVEYFSEHLQEILGATQGLMIFQEQTLAIAVKLAGFDGASADTLRRGIGKKKADVIASLRQQFIDGCIKVDLINKEQAIELFDQIEKSNRYSFNKSHAIAYALDGYWTAYTKAHYPLKFFWSWLNHAEEKPKPKEEIAGLSAEAKQFDIQILPPSIKYSDIDFTKHDQDNKIYFGLSNIKNIGKQQASTAIGLFKQQESTYGENITWPIILWKILWNIDKRAAEHLILTGCFSFLGLSRRKMIYEFNILNQLSAREAQYVIENNLYNQDIDKILDILLVASVKNRKLLNITRRKRISDLLNVIRKPTYDLSDNPDWVADKERELLGVALSYSKIDNCDTNASNSSCQEILEGKKSENIILGVEIVAARDYTITKGNSVGQIMKFLTVEDSTARIESVLAFPDTLSKYNNLLFSGNTVLLQCKSSQKGGLIVNKVIQI